MNALSLKQLINISKTLNILYVEDNEDARTQTLKMLQNYFTNIDVAVNGLEGLEKFKQNSYHLIFTDLNMPIMDGIEMIEKIREINLKIPIIVLSAHDDKEYFLETIKSGIDGYILKPYDFGQIVDTITKIVLKLDIDIQNSHKIHLVFEYIWDKEHNHLLKNDEIIKLTSNETQLIQLFIKRENETITSEDIQLHIFDETSQDTSKIRNLISRLKTKLNANLIESNYGLGYILMK